MTYYPDNILTAYFKTIKSFGNDIEYRTSRRSQELGCLVRMYGRESRWDFQLGLPSLVTSLIQLNMIRYPFVLPDMIGGNGYFDLPPSKEMYIRWMQAAVFMPVVQFSYPPWDFDAQVPNTNEKWEIFRPREHSNTINRVNRFISDVGGISYLSDIGAVPIFHASSQ